MKAMRVLCGMVLMGAVLVGCGSDPRDGLVKVTVDNMGTAATKVDNIKNRINEAVEAAKTAGAGKAPDFKDALKEVDALKGIAKEMQKTKLEVEALKDKTSEEERKEMASKNRDDINQAIERVAKAKRELNETMVSVEAEYRGALKEVRDKLLEADGEFESISRQR